MIEVIGTILGTIFSGGATGLLGIAAQRFADYKNKQLDMQLEAQRFTNTVALRKVDAEIMAMEAAAKVQQITLEGQNANALANIQNEGVAIAGADAAFAESFKLEPKQFATGKLTLNQSWLMVVLDFIRGFVRPGLTIYLCVLTTLIYFQAKALLSGSTVKVEDAMEITNYVIHSILYLNTTIVLWWFGTRNKQAK